MDIKQGCLTFRTNIFWELFHEMYEIGAAPIFERGSLSQYLILICHIKASVCHIRLHPWKLLAFTWQQAPWIIALNMESLLLLRRKRISCVDIFKTRAKKLLLHFPRRRALGRHFQQWRKAMVATSRHFPQWRKATSRHVLALCRRICCCCPALFLLATALQQRALACWIPSKESTAWTGRLWANGERVKERSWRAN